LYWSITSRWPIAIRYWPVLIFALLMSNRFISWSIFILLCFIWGSSFILMKIGYRELSAIQVAALRIFSGSVVFIPFAIFHIRKIPRRKIYSVLLAGLFGNLFPAFLFTVAITRMDSSLVGILNSLTPVCVIVLGISLFGDKIQTHRVIGVLVGFAGLCLLTFSQKDISLHNLGYSALVILATLCYGSGVNIVSHYLKGIQPIHISSISLSLLSIPTFIILYETNFFQLDFSAGPVQDSVIASLLLGFVGTSFATVIFYILVKRAGGLFASLVTYGIPFVAVLWGVRYGEPVTWMEIVSLIIILAGVYLANRQKKEF
jgi:drug/metabolite transporter (DMT)-like permease